jgi:hypothetical protein
MNNKNLLWIVGGCVGLLLICCVASAVVFVVAGNEIQKQISALTGMGEGLEIPTAMPVVPTPALKSTSVAPTKAASSSATSSIASSSAPAGTNPFASALSKAKSATKYRMQFSMLIGSTTSGKFVEETLFDMTGAVDGGNVQFSSKGGFLAILSGDPNGTVEFITAGGKTYMKGIKMFGLTDPKVWYVTNDNSTAGGLEDFAKPDTFKDYVDNAASFKKVGTEAVDGQSCDIWSGTISGFDTSMLGAFGGGKDTGDIGVVDKSETRIWLCADGYVHKFAVEFQGHNAKTPTEKGSFKMNGHMWDFNNAAIKVTPPADAKPMPGG